VAGLRQELDHVQGHRDAQADQRRSGHLLYTAGYAKAVWSSKCTGLKFPYLATQSDNNLVVYCGIEGTNALWVSNTAGI
jgi:hypothetical protein